MHRTVGTARQYLEQLVDLLLVLGKDVGDFRALRSTTRSRRPSHPDRAAPRWRRAIAPRTSPHIAAAGCRRARRHARRAAGLAPTAPRQVRRLLPPVRARLRYARCRGSFRGSPDVHPAPRSDASSSFGKVSRSKFPVVICRVLQSPHGRRGARSAPGEATHGMSECSDPVCRERRAPTGKLMSHLRRQPIRRMWFAVTSSSACPRRCHAIIDDGNGSECKPGPEFRTALRSQTFSLHFDSHVFP